MKLVDILALELKEWPEQYDCLSQMRHDGGIINGRGFDGVILSRLEIAEDSLPAGVIVTRAQWQAAADALKAEVRPAESMALHHQEVGRITRQWNGDGLPPVGTVCEMSIGDPVNGKWITGTVVCHINWERPVAVAHDVEDVFHGYAEDFRPIRTPEQIAADERDKAAEELYLTINWAETACNWANLSRGRREDYFKAIDAGFRKFEIVDN